MPKLIGRTFEAVERALGLRPDKLAQAHGVNPSARAARESLYAAAVHAWNLAFLSTDRDGLITGWNTGAENLFGHGAVEALGRDIEAVVRLADPTAAGTMRDHFLAGRRVPNLATTVLGKEGTPIDLVFDISPLRSTTNELVGASAIARDVTEQRLAEELFGLAVEASPSGMMMIDRRGRIVMVNREVERLFGYHRVELVGRPVETLVPENMRSLHVTLRAGFARQPESRKMGKGRELIAMRRDGVEFPVEIALNAVQVRDGLLILASIVDITERRQTERLKDEFVATVSHELRTPLASIAASLKLLAAGKGGELPPMAQRLVTIADVSGERLTRLVNDILEIEGIESGALRFQFGPVSMRAVVEQAVETGRDLAEQAGVRLMLEPSTSGDVWADTDRLVQVVTNLLSNAIKFSPAGEEVALAVDEDDNRVRLRVRDRGTGIPEKFKSRIFSKFAQADGSNVREKGGAGLGLSIVKQIVERLGGNVGFEAAEDGGTVFFVELPRSTATEGRPATDDGLLTGASEPTQAAISRG